jgi:hypothetical protein
MICAVGLVSFTACLIEDLPREERNTKVLDGLHEYLWFISKQSGSHIDALHQQILKRRTITIAEDAGLHPHHHYIPKAHPAMATQSRLLDDVPRTDQR